ncbi:MAG: RHS repeat domain-containing protein [Isosphaeraceae bacterium]
MPDLLRPPYNADGDRTSMSDSLGGLVSYTYNSRGQLANETLSGTGITPEAVAYTYDNAWNMSGLARYSDLAETTEVAATSYTYNGSQMTGITDTNSSGTTLVSYGYTYDAFGRVTQEARTWNAGTSTDTLTYGYTNNNQLTSVTHINGSFANESFTWDANGNQTGSGYTTSTGNKQTASPGYTYTYDADGNMITATQTSTGDVWTYTYDFRNRMTSAVETNASGTILAQVSYTYDALDNRIGRNENGVQTWTLYDGSTPIMDFTGAGSLATRYLNGPAGDLANTVLSRQSSDGTVSWYLPDRLGTNRDLINNTGSIIDHVDDSAFGTVLDESNPSNGDRMMGFAGLERDTVTGLNLAVERVQDPGTGRWTSQDPLGFAAGDNNLYRYGSGDPISNTDSSGLQIDLTQPLPLFPIPFLPPPPTPRIPPGARQPSPPDLCHGLTDYFIPGWLQVSPKFKPQGGPWNWIPEYDDNDPKNPFALPNPGKYYYPADAIHTPAGTLKIWGGTTVILVGSTPDGRPIFYHNGTVEWFPTPGASPFGDNPSTPVEEPWDPHAKPTGNLPPTRLPEDDGGD